MSKKWISDFINYDFHTPNDTEVRQYLENNFKHCPMGWGWNAKDLYISQTYDHTLAVTFNVPEGKFIPTEEFKELIGMTKKQFTKSDLKDGMRVVYRDGGVRYVMGNTLLMYEGSAYGNKGKYSHATYTDGYNADLKKSKMCDMDIMKVIDRDGTILFERVEKSQQEIEMDKLQKQIADLQEQANKLEATM